MLRPLCSAVLDELSTDEQITQQQQQQQQQQLTRNNLYHVNRYCCISYFNTVYIIFTSASYWAVLYLL